MPFLLPRPAFPSAAGQGAEKEEVGGGRRKKKEEEGEEEEEEGEEEGEGEEKEEEEGGGRVPMAELKFVGTQIQISELWRRYASQERELGHMVLEGLAVQRPL